MPGPALPWEWTAWSSMPWWESTAHERQLAVDVDVKGCWEVSVGLHWSMDAQSAAALNECASKPIEPVRGGLAQLSGTACVSLPRMRNTESNRLKSAQAAAVQAF